LFKANKNAVLRYAKHGVFNSLIYWVANFA
jgi:hypothetical protein